MPLNDKDTSLETLLEIRSIMDRSAKFLSLSGWSGVWAGSCALVGAYIANSWIDYSIYPSVGNAIIYDALTVKLLLLALGVFIVALAGGIYFTYKKTEAQGEKIWNIASRQMLVQAIIPMVTGGIFCIAFMYHGTGIYIAPACLAFYGLALISVSKHTLSDIKYLGILEVALGGVSLFMPGYGLYFWAAGFGVLHILYGIIMWNKYDKRKATDK